ncbi:MAG: hypothetical protein IJM79_00705 [Erysipelotrichaceae bacterium]|nr:hypothetical protein [Erysipelotrichaceae bacterium]
MRKTRIVILLILLAALSYAAVYCGSQEKSVSFLPLDKGLTAQRHASAVSCVQKLPLRPALNGDQPFNDADDAVRKTDSETEEREEGHWQDVYRPVTFYWLTDDQNGYQVFDDRMTWLRKTEELRAAGINVIAGTDCRNVRIGRIFLSGQGDEE